VLALVITVLGAVPDGVPPAARARYQDAVTKLSARQWGPANDVLNALASEFPRVPEIFASRCSAQLGLQHWAAAEADCNYTLQLKPLPTAVYGLAVAQDGQGKLELAIAGYRKYAGMLDAQASLKSQALSRADVLASRTGAAPSPPLVEASREVAVPQVAPSPPAPPPPGGGKGQFVPGIPDPNEGLLYVYRNMLMGVGTLARLYVDNVRIGELWNDHYFELRLRPGKHTVTVKAVGGRSEPAHSLEVEIEESSVSYAKLEYAPIGEDAAFKPIPVGKEGRKEIREDCELVYSKKL
jgi:hypothetical protein